MTTSLRITVLLMFVLSGCETRSSKFCAANPDDPSCGGGSGTDSGGGCDPACPSTQVCNDQNACVNCVTNADCHSGDKPVCIDADNRGTLSCHACRDGADCPDSDACSPDGSCAAVTDDAYVGGANAADTNPCSKDAPCATVMHAAMIKSTVVIEGQIDEKIMVNQPNLILIGGTGAVLTNSTSQAPITVAGPGTNLTIFNLYIGGTSAASPVANTCVNQGDGTVTLDHVELAFCSGGAVSVTKGQFLSSRSTMHDNPGGAITLGAMTTLFNITNTFIYGNGGDSFQGGNVVLVGQQAQNNVFEFNTIAFNKNETGTILAAGITCNGTHALPNNIVTHNVQNNGTVDTNESDVVTALPPVGCDVSASIVQADPGPFNFVKASLPFDLHITTGSIALDAAMTSSVNIDNKGTDRPQGTHPDKGADELIP